jgi:hypothetical protein
MRDHDLELIAALVEGRLQDDSEARALIDSAPELRAEYEAQRLAFETLRGLGPTQLSDTERAALHRDLWTELRSGAEARPARRPWYYTWASVAAGLFVIVGLVTVLDQTGGDQQVFLAADLTTVADSINEEDAGSDSAAGGGEAEVPEPPADAGDGATVSTVAASEGLETTQLSAEAENVRQGAFSAELQQYDGEDVARSSTIEACVDRANLEGYDVAALLTPSDETAVSTTIAGDEPAETSSSTTMAEVEQARLAVAYPENTDLATAPLAFVDLTNCEVVYLDE